LVRLVLKSKVKSIFFLQSLIILVNVEFYVSFLYQFGIEKWNTEFIYVSLFANKLVVS